MEDIKLSGIIEESYTDGIGIRYTIFVQGCAHKCYNCQNPETWDFNSGKFVKIDTLITAIKANPLLDGVTISGGDPMYQPLQIFDLVKRIKQETNLNIWIYTGFTYEECIKNKDMLKILEYTDVLVDGPYKESDRSLQLRFRGSKNQRIIDVQKSLKNNNVSILLD